MNQSSGSHTDFSRLRVHLFLESILSTVCFVAHHDDVPSVRQRCIVVLELLHRREDDAIGIASFQQFAQMLASGGLHRHLSQEVLALGKLTVELVVEVVAVGDDHDGGLRHS